MDIQRIENNWETFTQVLGRLNDDNIGLMLDSLGERIAACPSSMKIDQPGCHPGGLVENSLEVTSVMRSLNDALDYGYQIQSLIKVGLLHDIGKIGNLEKEYFLPQESEWHREKLGQMFIYNPDLQKMSVTHRTLYILQNFGVSLSEEEWIAIQISSGTHFEENRFYVGSEPTLALCLSHAKQIVNHRHLSRNN